MTLCPYCEKVYDESEYSRCPYCSGDNIKKINVFLNGKLIKTLELK